MIDLGWLNLLIPENHPPWFRPIAAASFLTALLRKIPANLQESDSGAMMPFYPSLESS